MIRIPDAGRFELRLADGAANPYLLQAGVFAAGLDGIAEKRDPGKRLDINMYTDGHKARAPKSCRSTCSTRCGSSTSRRCSRGVRREFIAAYIKLKTEDWNDYSRHLTEWERQTTLDC